MCMIEKLFSHRIEPNISIPYNDCYFCVARQKENRLRAIASKIGKEKTDNITLMMFMQARLNINESLRFTK